jgi:hypothetical protein
MAFLLDKKSMYSVDSIRFWSREAASKLDYLFLAITVGSAESFWSFKLIYSEGEIDFGPFYPEIVVPPCLTRIDSSGENGFLELNRF